MTTHHDRIEVRIEDDYTGEFLKTIPIDVTYVIEKDTDYGADADGQRGVSKETFHFLDMAVQPDDLKRITLVELEYIIDRAVKTITERPVAL